MLQENKIANYVCNEDMQEQSPKSIYTNKLIKLKCKRNLTGTHKNLKGLIKNF